MGAIADGIARYAQPLIDSTDGSIEQVQRAFSVTQLCWNLAVSPPDRRAEMLADIRSAMNLADAEFQEFERSIILPMIRRHEEMFPRLHGERPTAFPPQPNLQLSPPHGSGQYPGARRNAKCPCGSGRKYKVCCGRRYDD